MSNNINKSFGSFSVFSFLFFLFIVTTPLAEASEIFVTPARMNIENLQRDGYAEREVRLSTNREQPLTITHFFEEGSELEDWVTVETSSGEDTFTISQGNPQIITLIFNPPASIPNGVYEDVFRLRELRDDSFEGDTGAVVEVAVGVRITAEISDLEVVDCVIISSSIENVERGNSATLSVDIMNRGNILLTPDLSVDISDQGQSNILESFEFSDSSILPSVRETLSFSVPTNSLNIGQYFVGVESEICDYDDTLTFDLLEPGTISVQGVLRDVTNNPWNYVGDEVTVRATFENTGESVTSAIFRGSVYLEGEEVESLESGTVDVRPEEVYEYELNFVPDEPGRYEVRGRIYYDNKQSFEKSSRINVNPASQRGADDSVSQSDVDETSFSFNFTYVLFAGIAVLSFLIISKKRSVY